MCFNLGKSRLRFEILSHREMVVDPLKKMGEDNQQLMHFKDKAARHQKQAKALEESVNAAGAKLRQTLEETKVVRLRIKKHHEENKDEVYIYIYMILHFRSDNIAVFLV